MKFQKYYFLSTLTFLNTLFFKCYRSEKVMGHFYNNMLCAYISFLFHFKENAKIVRYSRNCELIGPAIKSSFSCGINCACALTKQDVSTMKVEVAWYQIDKMLNCLYIY